MRLARRRVPAHQAAPRLDVAAERQRRLLLQLLLRPQQQGAGDVSTGEGRQPQVVVGLLPGAVLPAAVGGRRAAAAHHQPRLQLQVPAVSPPSSYSRSLSHHGSAERRPVHAVFPVFALQLGVW